MLPRVAWWKQTAVAGAAFGLGVGVAEAFGASSLGVAFGFGQIAFALAVVGLLLWT
jgi:hypothetical protein